jgi:hypothetical protein
VLGAELDKLILEMRPGMVLPSERHREVDGDEKLEPQTPTS